MFRRPQWIYTFVWITPAFEEVKEQMLSASIDVEVARVHINGRVAKATLLNANLVMGKPRMRQSRELIGCQRRQMQILNLG